MMAKDLVGKKCIKGNEIQILKSAMRILPRHIGRRWMPELQN